MRQRPIARLFFGKILNADLAAMAGDEFWASPEIAAVADDRYRSDLARLAAATPRLLEQLAELPMGMSHGDAAPDNLLDAGDGSVTAIDRSYASVAPVGSDLGQLLSGRVADEDPSADEFRARLEVAIRSFGEGFADEGGEFDRVAARQACITYLTVRFVFSALLLEPHHDVGDDATELLARRAALGRVGLDLALELVDGPAT